MASRLDRRLLRSVSGPGSRLSLAAATSVGATLAGVGSRFLLQILIARLLGTTGYGRFVALRGWAELLATLPNRGFQGAVVRFLPTYEQQEDWPRYRGLLGISLRRTLWGGLALAAGASLVASIVGGSAQLAFLLAFAALPAWAAIRMLQAVLQAQHQYVAATLIVQLLQPLVLAIGLGGTWLAGLALGLDGALGLFTLSVAVAAVAAAWSARTSTPEPARSSPPTTDAGAWGPAARRFFTSQLAISVIGMADVLILSMFVAPSDVALYAIAVRIAFMGRLVNSGLESIVSPHISAAWARDDRPAIQRSVNHSIALSIGPTVAFATAMALFPEAVLGVVGEAYRSAASVLVIVLIGNVVNALTGPSGYVVSLTGNESVHARIMAVTAVVLVALCFAVAGPGGIVAVAWVRTVADTGWNLALVVFARRELGIRCYPNRDLLHLRSGRFPGRERD